ncbi:MAG: DUF1573 domain-containing protein [Bacteroidetes bacterium]|nr:DUF1573 domain-containing protein [Bacteroidota bacterium]
MKKNYSVISAIMLFVCISLSAQTVDPNIDFHKLEHDFGTIEETDGKVNYKFEFTNIGSKPVIVSNVHASCGCTTPEWTKQPVLPGTSGFVEVSYNPANRPGPFRKSITITSNAVNSPITLYIKGNVKGEEKSIMRNYRYKIGDLRLTSNHISLGNIANGETGSTTVDVMNSSNHNLALSFKNVPDYITIEAQPNTLKSQESGQIKVTFNAAQINDWDFILNRIELLLNNQQVPDNRISVSAVVVEDFSDLSDQELAEAPKVYYPEKTFDFGSINADDKPVSYNFIVKNNGKSDLIIRKVKASCGCTAVKPEKNILAPGESTQLKATFNPAGRSGSQRKSITIITNDPVNYKSILWVKGNVEK